MRSLRRLLAAALVAVLVLFLAGCGEEAAPAATPHAPVRPAAATSAPPTPEPTPEPTPAQEPDGDGQGEIPVNFDPNYADKLHLESLEHITILDSFTQAQPAKAEDAGWKMLGQSTKSLAGDVLCADDYLGQWLLALKGEGGDTLVKMINFTSSLLYTCTDVYPSISGACMNAEGAYWLEHSASQWRLMLLKNGAKEPEEIETGSYSGDQIPRITAPEHNAMVLYDPADGLIRIMDGETGTWRENRGQTFTVQLTPPEVVGDYLTWIEESSIGWVVVAHNILTGEEQGYLLEEIKRPYKATFDGQLMFVYSTSGALYCLDVPGGVNVYLSGYTTGYHHIPGEGAIVASMGSLGEELTRFQYQSAQGGGQHALIPLLRIKDGGRLVRAFHHGDELDSEMFLIVRDGQFEQSRISMRRTQAAGSSADLP